MKTMQQWLDEYAESHQHPTNIAIHWVCVPLIFFSIVCFLLPVRPIPGLSLASMVMILVLLFYFRLSKPITLGMLGFYVFCLLIAKLITILSAVALWKIALAIFVVAWIGQFIGHRIEGKKPSFFKDIQFLLIGPAWLIAKLCRRFNITY